MSSCTLFNLSRFNPRLLRCTVLIDYTIMASSSRETTINQQHISDLTVTAGGKLFAGTSTNTIYNAKKKKPSYYEIPNLRVDGFVGRENILQKIDESLSDGPGPRYAVLQGIAGQGKSQVALEYCHRKKGSPYSAIFWVDAKTEGTVKGSFQSISECIKVETDYLPNIDARVAFVLKSLTSWTVPWLMVFDDYDHPDTFLNIRNFIPQSELGAILFTSRHPDSKALVIHQSNHFLELLGLEDDAAIALLLQQSQTSEVISSNAKKIVERLGHHPLAITQAGAYIRKRKLRLNEFMDHYKRRKKIILESTPQLSQYRKRLGNAEEETSLNVFTTWELSFQQFQSEASENDVATKLLTLMAFFDEKDISEQLFAGFSANQKQISECAKLLIWLHAFSSAEGKWDRDFFADILIRLSDSSLLQTFTQGLDGFYHASLHPLTKDWIQLRTNKSTNQENTCMAGTLVALILVNSWQKQQFHLPLLTKQNITSHIIALEESYQEFFISQPFVPSNRGIFDEYTASHSWFARFLSMSGSYHLEEIINQRLNSQNVKVLGLEHPDTLISMDNLASTFLKQGRWKEAEELFTQVLEKELRVRGPGHPDTLSCMTNLALTISNQGRWKEAEELQVQAIERSSRVRRHDHPSTLISMINLTWTFMNQGRWKEAQALGSQVMEKSSRVQGLEHPSTLASMAYLALTYQKQGRWEEAEELEARVMETNSRVQGLEHPSTLSSMANLALTNQSQGRWKEAEALQVQVMETSSRVQGLEHPETLTNMSNLTLTFCLQGRLKEAEKLQVQVLETSSRVLGHDHPATLTRMSILASTFWSLGLKKEAIQMMTEVVQHRQEKIGSDHPDTISSIKKLQKWQNGKN